MAVCLRCFANCLLGADPVMHSRMEEMPSVTLDTEHMGNDVVIVKNGRRICGRGGALCTMPIAQNKAYFEVKVQQSGAWGLGVANRRTDLSKLPLGADADSWVLRQDGSCFHDNQKLAECQKNIEEGDVIGVTFDHVELVFYLNGVPLNLILTGFKGMIYPLVYVDDGAILEVSFADFACPIPSGFQRIMVEQTIL